MTNKLDRVVIIETKYFCETINVCNILIFHFENVHTVTWIYKSWPLLPCTVKTMALIFSMGWVVHWFCCNFPLGNTFTQIQLIRWTHHHNKVEIVISVLNSTGAYTFKFSCCCCLEHLQTHAADTHITQSSVSSCLKLNSRSIKDTSWDPEENFWDG